MDLGRGEYGTDDSVKLLGGICERDPQAEAAFVAGYLPGIRALAKRQCRSGDEITDDVTQAVVERLLVNLRGGQLRDPLSLPAYVRMTTLNFIAAEYRRPDRAQTHDSGALLDIADGDTPEDHAHRAITGQFVSGLVDQLPVERDRELLRRYYLQEEAQDRICADLKIERGLFRRVLHRARERLRLLAEQLGTRPPAD